MKRIFCAALLGAAMMAHGARAQGYNAIIPNYGGAGTSCSTSSLGTSDTKVCSGGRWVYLLLQNNGTTDEWCVFGNGATATAAPPSLKLASGAGWTWEGSYVPSTDLHCLSVGGTGALTVWSR